MNVGNTSERLEWFLTNGDTSAVHWSAAGLSTWSFTLARPSFRVVIWHQLPNLNNTHTTHSERYKSHTNTNTDMKHIKVQRYPLETDPDLSGLLSSMAFHSWSIHSCLTSAVSAAYSIRFTNGLQMFMD